MANTHEARDDDRQKRDSERKKSGAPLSLGLDLSTQSLTGVLIDPAAGKIVYENSLSYVKDERLNGLGIDHRSFLVPPRRDGEADQPPELFLAALEAFFSDMVSDGVQMQRIAVINISAQQHGHVYLNSSFEEALQKLRIDNDAPEGAGTSALPELLSDVFSYRTAPIWMTSDTEEEAAEIKKSVGGKERMIELSGSDSPLRFTGAVIRRVGKYYPQEYYRSEKIPLLNTFLAAVLSAESEVPVDYGNACGMSLMNYRTRCWDENLLEAVGGDLSGGTDELRKKLGGLDEPYRAVGTIAGYFRNKYGFPENCRIAAGSGDNPQTKVLVPGDLLSLGTSFVNMVSTEGGVVDENGYANAMYDGLGRPFMFGCRTNGALVWDRLRALYGLSREEYEEADKALLKTSPGESFLLWQPSRESFPDSPEFPLTRLDEAKADLAGDYSGLIDGTLSLLYYYSRPFSPEGSKRGYGRPEEQKEAQEKEPLYVTGGPAESEEILKRVAAIWKRPVVTIGKVGAALGAAAAGLETLRSAERKALASDDRKPSRSDGRKPSRSDGPEAPKNSVGRPTDEIDVEETIRKILPVEKQVSPDPEYLEAYHGEGGFIERYISEFEELTKP